VFSLLWPAFCSHLGHKSEEAAGSFVQNKKTHQGFQTDEDRDVLVCAEHTVDLQEKGKEEVD